MINFAGIDSFVWWTGVVEDVDDPEALGRVRVRIHGFHTDDKSKIPKDKLPWASPIMPMNSASIGGFGTSPTGVTTDAWVVGFFRDGEYAQDPIIWGTVPGRRSDDGKVKSDLSQRSTGQDVDNTSMNKSLKQVDSCKLFDEPASPYGAKYPYNMVTETRSGHIIEYDDTPGKERIMHYHRTGTFEEYHPDGTKVDKTKKDYYHVVHGDKFVHIKGNLNIVVDGHYNLIVNQEQKMAAGKNIDIKSGETTTMKAPKIDLNP